MERNGKRRTIPQGQGRKSVKNHWEKGRMDKKITKLVADNGYLWQASFGRLKIRERGEDLWAKCKSRCIYITF